MTEAVITDLSKIGALKVISRTSALRYKGTDKPLAQIARELDVAALVEGSVLRAGDRVRITAQLIEAATDRHLWAESYERDLKDILALQGEVARAIAREIRVRLTPAQAGGLAGGKTVNPEAYEAYLRGRHHWNRRFEPDLRKALEHFRRAIEIDPGFAPAYAGLADTYSQLDTWGYATAAEETYPKAKRAVEKALSLDDSLAETHAASGWIRFHFESDWDGAGREYRRSIELNPGYSMAHLWYAFLLFVLGRTEEALQEALLARQLDPLSVNITANVGRFYNWAGRPDEAIASARSALAMDPDFPEAHRVLGNAYARKRMFPEAIAALEQARRLRPEGARYVADLGCAYAWSGNREAAMKTLADLGGQRDARSFYLTGLAAVHACLGETDQALAYLERAYQERTVGWWVKDALGLRSLRSDPRFVDLLRRMGLPAD